MNKTHLDSELGNIDDTKLYVMPRNDTKIAFEEILDLVDEEGRQVDTLTVAVEMGELDTFSVYQYSNDQGIMMRVQSRVLRSLDTEWEVRHLRRPGSSKMLRISVSDKKYRLFKSVQGKDANREKINIKKVPHVRMILEGANIILLRKLAVSRSFGRFKCQTVNHDGEVCECEYVVERGANLDVRVRRTLRDREIMTTTLSKTGRIILHAWSTTGYTLRSRDSGTSTAARLAEEERIALGESELKADVKAYFKKKAEVTNQINEYLLGQPEVKDMIADFLKELLIEKPEDVVSFADDYFSEFVGIVREPVKNEEPLLPSSEGVYRQPTNEDVQ